MSRRSRRRSGPRATPVARTRLPAELGREIATTHDGRDITRPYTYELEEFRDQRLQGAVDWGVYDRILLDDQVKSCLEQRRSAVVSREWSVISGDADDPRANAAAEALDANISALDWDGITDKMLYAPFHGFAVAEIIWGPRDGLIGFADIRVRHARRFRFDKLGRLRLITATNLTGEVLPDRKFWTVKAGASDDDQPYGRGLAEWLYWPTLFKRNGIRFWNTFLDKFSIPPVRGSYRAGTPREEIDKLLQAMMALANDSGIALPEGVTAEFMQVATTGIDFEKMPAYMDGAIAKIILSQTMTTDDGASRSQAQVHQGVKQELVVADADLLTGGFSRGPARWWTDLNFGADVAAPIVMRLVEEEEDIQRLAETDQALRDLGYHRTEESFRDVYGDGYERADPADPPRRAGEGDRAKRGGGEGPEPANDDEAEATLRTVSFAEAAAEAAGPDIVDLATAELIAGEGWRADLAPMVEQLVEQLVKAKDFHEVEAILARADLVDTDPLAQRLARAAFAVRIAAATGSEQVDG